MEAKSKDKKEKITMMMSHKFMKMKELLVFDTNFDFTQLIGEQKAYTSSLNSYISRYRKQQKPIPLELLKRIENRYEVNFKTMTAIEIVKIIQPNNFKVVEIENKARPIDLNSEQDLRLYMHNVTTLLQKICFAIEKQNELMEKQCDIHQLLLSMSTRTCNSE